MLTIDELPKDLVTETKVFHFGTLSMTGEPARSTTKEAVRMAKEAGAMITFDPNLRRPLWSSMELAREQMLWGLRHADVVKIGRTSWSLSLRARISRTARKSWWRTSG